MKKKATKTRPRWEDEMYIVDGSIVGTVEKDAFGRGYWAFGCLTDWQDTKLGFHESESTARRRVEQWVKDIA